MAPTVDEAAAASHLTPLEQSLLYLLAANAGRVVTRDEILDYLWGADYMAESNVVDRHIRPACQAERPRDPVDLLERSSA